LSLEHLRNIRLYEIEQVMPYMQPGQCVLEIGAGAGWQAQYMAGCGLKVVAIDIPNYEVDFVTIRIWPVIAYDGTHIPLADGSVDVVFSSNVLEHVKNLAELQHEIKRVLKPEGCTIHLLPTPAWRFWTALTFYPDMLRRVVRKALKIAGIVRLPATGNNVQPTSLVQSRSPLHVLKSLVWPGRHGETGNMLTELYYFSRRHWQYVFEKSGWRVEHVFTNRLFYTGCSLFDARLPFSIRRRMSHVLGSACWIFILNAPVTNVQKAGSIR
jgi:SAM-dependent methyltransferase